MIVKKHITPYLLKTKAKAALIHFGICLSVFLIILAWTWLFGYQGSYFSMAGAVHGLLLVFFVDVVLGPLLSFMVYNPNKSKKEMSTDFALIGLVQLAALVYGVYTLYQEHPKALLIYPDSTATVISQRELQDFPELQDLSKYQKIDGLPAPVLNKTSTKRKYLTLSQAKDLIVSTSETTRKFIAQDPKALESLNAIDSQYPSSYVIGVMAKYNGAYFVLDQNMNFLTKFAEKPIN